MKTSKAQFKIFEKETRKLLKLHGLVGYEKYIEHKDIDNTTISTAIVDLVACYLIITLNKDTPYKLSTEMVEDSAYHEVLEVFFWKLESLIPEHFKEEGRAEIHKIIQTLINIRRVRIWKT